MRPKLAWLVLPSLFLNMPASAAEAPGAIKGSVRYTGKVPPPKKLATNDGTLLHNDLVVDGKTRGLRHVVAVLEDAPAQPKVKNAKAAVMDQREMLFVPRVVAVQHGQAVRFENSDAANHGVAATSAVPGNQFNLVTPPGQALDHVFEPQKHPIPIGCALHAWMRAWVFAVPHPWFAVSDERGEFHIKDVPPGKYILLLRHPDTGLQERRQVQVKAGATVELAIEWKKSAEK